MKNSVGPSDIPKLEERAITLAREYLGANDPAIITNSSLYAESPDAVLAYLFSAIIHEDISVIAPFLLNWRDADIQEASYASLADSLEIETVDPIQFLHLLELVFTLKEPRFCQIMYEIIHLYITGDLRRQLLVPEIATILFSQLQLCCRALRKENHDTALLPESTELLLSLENLFLQQMERGCEAPLLLSLFEAALADSYFLALFNKILIHHPVCCDYFTGSDPVENIRLLRKQCFTFQTWFRVTSIDEVLFTLTNNNNDRASAHRDSLRCSLVDAKLVINDIYTAEYVFRPHVFYNLTLVYAASALKVYVNGELIDRCDAVDFKAINPNNEFTMTMGEQTSFTNVLVVNRIQPKTWISLCYYMGVGYTDLYQSNCLSFLNYDTLCAFELRLIEWSKTNAPVDFSNMLDPSGVLLHLTANNASRAVWRAASVYHSLYTIGGVALLLRLIESSDTSETILLALELLFRCLSDWRLIREMESLNGYDILATILKTKPNLIDHQILDLVLAKVGFDFDNPIDTIIINPIAYRSLITDFDIWNKLSTSSSSFKFLIYQFTVFGQDSRYHQFNIKKLIKMKIIKRFIQALKCGTFDTKMLPVVYNSLSILVKANPSVEVIRSLTSYIIYALNYRASEPLRSESNETPQPQGLELGSLQQECGTVVLRLLTDVVLEAASPVVGSSSKRYSQMYRNLSKAVSIRWILLVLNSDNAEVIRLGFTLLAQMLSVLGTHVYDNFIRFNGLEILTHALGKWWSNGSVSSAIFAAAFGILNDQQADAGYSLLQCARGPLRHTRVSVKAPDYMYLFNNIVLSSLKVAASGPAPFLLINDYVAAMEVCFEETPIKGFCYNKTWLSQMMVILGRLEMLRSMETADVGVEGSFTSLKRFLGKVFIERLFEPSDEFARMYGAFGDEFKFLTVQFLYSGIVDHVNQFVLMTPDVFQDPVLLRKLTQVLGQCVQHTQIYRGTHSEANALVSCVCSVIEVNSRSQDDCVRVLKQNLGSLLLHMVLWDRKDSTEEFSYSERLLKLLLLHQGTIFGADVLDNRLAGPFLACLLLSVNTQVVALLRSFYLQRSKDVEEINRLLGSSLLAGFLEHCVTSTDEEVMSELAANYNLVGSLEVSVTRRIEQYPVAASAGDRVKRIIQEFRIFNSKLIDNFQRENQKWTQNILQMEVSKFHRHIQDHQDNLQFYITAYNRIKTETSRLLKKEADVKYYVDSIEGLDRMRMRLLPLNDVHESERLSYSIDVPVLQSEEAPDTSMETFELVEESQSIEEDKNRKVLRSLAVGDSITHIWNISQILGLSAVEGLCILGNTHLYLIDNYFHGTNGEVVNIEDAPTASRDPYLKLITGRESEVRAETSTTHRVRSWRLDELASISKKQFLFRDVALELFFVDGGTVLLTCLNPKQRDSVHSKLSQSATGKGLSDDLTEALKLAASSAAVVAAKPSFFSSKIISAFNSMNIGIFAATKKWKRGEISNLYYLMLVNTLAGRTCNDLTQYPVFPWVIADYTSDELDLDDPKSFRDLSKPMGAQSEERLGKFRERYEALESLEDRNAPPFHYGTHYSSSMIVTSYLIRLEPYVQSYLLLQGGRFDHADRLFYSIPKTWTSASRDNSSDVRELIPEFFYLPEFLTNDNNFEFGKLQSGETINNVELPPWAKGDPKIFIRKNREALESPYVSQNLHKWIDLIFGYKQNGPEAIAIGNVFHNLSYHGAVNLDDISDEMQKSAMTGIIHNFGQTPLQIFKQPHSAKGVLDSVDWTKEILDGPSFTLESKSKEPVSQIEMSTKTRAWRGRPFLTSNSGGVSMKKGPSPTSLYVNGKIVESFHNQPISALVFATESSFLTGSTDGTIHIWKYTMVGGETELEFQEILRGHIRGVWDIQCSRPFNMALSVDEAGAVLLWDLSRYKFVRRFKSGEEKSVSAIGISSETGCVGYSVGSLLHLFTLNGEPILVSDCRESVSCIEFGRCSGRAYFKDELVAVGMGSTVVVYKLRVGLDGKWTLTRARSFAIDKNAEVTRMKLLLTSEIEYEEASLMQKFELVCGDSRGKIYAWR